MMKNKTNIAFMNSKQILRSVLSILLLLTLIIPVTATAETAAGDSFETAIALPVNASGVKGVIEDGKNTYYKVKVTAPGKLTIQVKAQIEAGASVWIQNEQKEQIMNCSVLNEKSESMTKNLDKGIYYIRISSSYFGKTGTFTITTKFRKLEGTIVGDKNKTFETAYNLDLNQNIKAVIPSSGVSSYYKITQREYGKLSFTLTSEAKCNISLEVLDTKKQLVSSSLKGVLLNQDGNGKLVCSTSLPPGEYYICITPLGSGEGMYQLKAAGYLPVTSLKLAKTSVQLGLAANTSYTIKQTIKPANATKSLVYTSSNKKIASVSVKGVVTAKAGGKTTITVKDKKSSKSAKLKVTVVDDRITSIQLAKSATVGLGENKQLKAIVKTKTSKVSKKLKWSSSNSKVAKVNAATGTVTGVKPGKCTITAVSAVNKQKKAVCTIQVIDNRVTKVALSRSSYRGDTSQRGFQLNANVSTRSSSISKAVTWTSSNQKVAAVSQSGYVTIKGSGTCSITAVSKVDKSKKASCSVSIQTYVKPKDTDDDNTNSGSQGDDKKKPEEPKVTIIPVSSFNVSVSRVTVKVGQSVSVSVSVNPSNATVDSVSWSSSNSSIASISGSGKTATITGKKKGTTVLFVSVNGKSAKPFGVTVE